MTNALHTATVTVDGVEIAGRFPKDVALDEIRADSAEFRKLWADGNRASGELVHLLDTIALRIKSARAFGATADEIKTAQGGPLTRV
jgi:hypothetical protein